MAAGNCAAGVSRRCTTRRRHRRPQQQGQNSTAATMAVATAWKRCVQRPPPPPDPRVWSLATSIGTLMPYTSWPRHSPGLSNSWQSAPTRTWSTAFQSAPPTSSMGTWSSSLISSSVCPGMRTPWEPTDGGQWVSMARRPCWWTGASGGCWLALWHCCSSRPCPLSWEVWALWSGGWRDADISKKGRAGQCDLQYRPSRVGTWSLLTMLSSSSLPPPPVCQEDNSHSSTLPSRNGPW